MANIFNSVLAKKPNKTNFNKSFNEKYTTNLGILYPIFFEEVVPGSKVSLNSAHFVRFQPMLAPIFDSVEYKQYYFFVPYRLLWKQNSNFDKWDDFRTGGRYQNFADFTIYNNNIPHWSTDQHDVGMINPKFLNSFEFPVSFINSLEDGLSREYICWDIPAYWKIIVDYFADEQLDADLLEWWEDFFHNDDEFTIYNFFNYDYTFANFFRKRYKKDYFTSALTSPQLGTGISLPLNTGLTLQPLDTSQLNVRVDNIIPELYDMPSQPLRANDGLIYQTNDVLAPTDFVLSTLTGRVYKGDNINSTVSLEDIVNNINIRNNTLFSINDLRNSFLLQEMLERNNVAGYRYFEWIKSHFGLSSPDARLQRSELLC